MAEDRRFRAALVQLCAGREIAPNMAFASGLIRAAAAGGAHYIQTPENTVLVELSGERLFERVRPEAETTVLGEFAALAEMLGVWLHIGSIAIRVGERKAANRSYVFAPTGRIAARYDKIHMFDVDLPSGESYREFEELPAWLARRDAPDAVGRAGHDDVLRPALSGAVQGSGAGWRGFPGGAIGVYPADRRRALAGTVARPCNRDRLLCHGGSAGRRP